LRAAAIAAALGMFAFWMWRHERSFFDVLQNNACQRVAGNERHYRRAERGCQDANFLSTWPMGRT
jgi:hypothetical protein